MRTFAACLLTIGFLSATTAQAQVQLPSLAWSQYENSVDQLVQSYALFTQPDATMRTHLLQDYKRAEQLVTQYERSDVVPSSPLVTEMTLGTNEIDMSGRDVVVALAPKLECTGITIQNPSGEPAHVFVIAGTPGFSIGHNPDAKFLASTFTIPAGESTVQIQGDSWHWVAIGVIGVAAVVTAYVLTRPRAAAVGTCAIAGNPSPGCNNKPFGDPDTCAAGLTCQPIVPRSTDCLCQ